MHSQRGHSSNLEGLTEFTEADYPGAFRVRTLSDVSFFCKEGWKVVKAVIEFKNKDLC